MKQRIVSVTIFVEVDDAREAIRAVPRRVARATIR